MKATTVLLLAWMLCLTACVNLKPQPDRTQIFTLASDVPVGEEMEGQPEVYVGRVELPGFLEGTRIFYRSAGNRLDSFFGARWAEAPIEALPRAIALHLQATGRVNVRAHHPWANTVPDAPKISVQFERFSADPSGLVEVIAQWQIESANGQLKQGRYIASQLEWIDKDAASYVAQLDAGLAGLAEVIAREL